MHKKFDESKTEKGYPIYQCKNCGAEIPPLYVDGYWKYPPVIISLVGFTRHGKTVYIASLFRALQELSKFWRGFHYKLLDEHGLDTVRRIQMGMDAGELPPPSQKLFPKPLLVRLVKMPILRPVTLVIYDQSGEVFDNIADIREYADYIKESPVMLFVHSISPVDDVANSLGVLLGRYALGMAALGAPKRKQHLVVALTKADEVTFPLAHLPLQQQLARGSLADAFVDNSRWKYRARARQYMKTVRGRSKQLEEFVAGQQGGAAFLAFCRNQFRSNSHAVSSALGERPEDGKLRAWRPKQVLDAMLLVIDKSIPWWRRRYWRWWLTIFALLAAIIGAAVFCSYW